MVIRVRGVTSQEVTTEDSPGPGILLQPTCHNDNETWPSLAASHLKACCQGACTAHRCQRRLALLHGALHTSRAQQNSEPKQRRQRKCEEEQPSAGRDVVKLRFGSAKAQD